jgi:VRR-NUC domain
MLQRSNEHAEQSAFIQWARTHDSACRIFAVPNGGHRSKFTAVKLKAEGVRPGVPDLMLPLPRGGSAGLFIEMKYGRNNLTAEQKRETQQLANDGYVVVIAWTAPDAIRMTHAYLAGRMPPQVFIAKEFKESNAPVTQRLYA